MKKLLLLLSICFSGNALAGGAASVSKNGTGKYLLQKPLMNNFTCNNNTNSQEIVELRHTGLVPGKKYRWASCSYGAGTSVNTNFYFVWNGGTTVTGSSANWFYVRAQFTNQTYCWNGTFTAVDGQFRVFCGSPGLTVLVADQNLLPSGFSGLGNTTYSLVEEIQ